VVSKVQALALATIALDLRVEALVLFLASTKSPSLTQYCYTIRLSSVANKVISLKFPRTVQSDFNKCSQGVYRFN